MRWKNEVPQHITVTLPNWTFDDAVVYAFIGIRNED